MVIKATLFTLLVLLVLVVASSYYVNKEAFEDITAGKAIPGETRKINLTTQQDGIFLNIIANTTDGSTIYGAKLLYCFAGRDSQCSPILKPGESTDDALALDLVIPPTPWIIANPPLTQLRDNHKYYLVTSDVTHYTEGVTPLLASFTYNKSPSPAPAPSPNPTPSPSPNPTPSPAPTPGPTPAPTPSPNGKIIPGEPRPSWMPTILPGVPTPGCQQSSTVPQREDVTPEISISGSGYDAMTLKQKMDLLKDIQKVVRNEILAGRSTQPVLSGETRKGQMTDATAQGQEYEGSCYKDTEYRCPKNPDGSCPPIPDMTQYIKKDAIPCWGCSLDY